MEIHMKKLNYAFNHTQITQHLARALHGPDFLPDPTALYNFHVHLFKDKRGIGRLHSGSGCITFPTEELGLHFLAIYGDAAPRKAIPLGGMQIVFDRSRNAPREDVLQSIRLVPYRDPMVIAEEERHSQELAAKQIPIRSIQFGWECRDNVISIEAEDSPRQGVLCFDEDRRQFRAKFIPSIGDGHEYIVAMRVSSILLITTHNYLRREPVVVFILDQQPTYELNPKVTIQTEDPFSTGSLSDPFASLPNPFSTGSLSHPFSPRILVEVLQRMTLLRTDNPALRQQVSFLPIADHDRVAPFASLVVRIVFSDPSGIHQFKTLKKLANVKGEVVSEYLIEKRGLFSQAAMDEFQDWTRKLNWEVAYQVESIVRARSVDVKEMLDILPAIADLVKSKGKKYTSAMLRSFSTKVKALFHSGIDDDTTPTSVATCFHTTEQEFSKSWSSPQLQPTDGSLYQSLHVIVTPTSILLDGPFPERSNRVIRAYDPQHQESFLRVTFAEEGRLQYRSNDREVDHRDFIEKRFGDLMLNGLTIAKRKFYFLAYSQSALKEHSVWFVKPFVDSKKGRVTAASIIQSLGNFDELAFDSQLMYCPARYAARLSQAFTATDASLIEVEEIINIPDIETIAATGQKHCFTDGVGTLSADLAKEVWKDLKRTKRRARSLKEYPSAYQVRFMGSKGMLSVDYRLRGSVICLRPSMIKFEAPNSTVIEIARSFDRPTPYFLNRPLIMLMEGLGVGYDIFKRYQDRAVRETHRAVQSIETAARMLEVYGLGSSFRLSSVLINLDKLGIRKLNEDNFYHKAMEYATNHIFRLLKNHARIPIPDAWTLVGVADVHKTLKPDEIFAYVKPLDERGRYLEGPILISRSPTIHPGDVRVVNAIGRPPQGSPFEFQSLANTVVFSVLGDRPLPSCLGGGDLDGDIYNLIPLSDPNLAAFRPSPDKENQTPSHYAPATRKLLKEKSTMKDVAQFVMEYISSDVLGIIAINWLIIADQSPKHIFDADCLKLADLHSDAVDYPKSGNPVSIKDIPRLKPKLKPDWNAPETLGADILSKKFYPSQCHIGKLFREIELPVDQHSGHGATRVQSHNRRRRAQADHDDNTLLGTDPYFSKIKDRVEEFIATEEPFSDALYADADLIYSRYTSELEGICFLHTLSNARGTSLAEEEAIIGTIFQKTSQPRKRQDMMAKLREATDTLVRGTREVLEGLEADTAEDYLQRAWFAWSLSLDKGSQFGARSFGWVALGALFDAIKRIEDEEEKERLSTS